MEDVQQLKTFLAVADNLSFTRAAEKLFLTQSAVSHQIARLERALGAELLVRQGRSISLTPAGRVLVTHARRIFAELRDAESAVRHATHPNAGRLRIGASATACQHIIPQALREFRESFPAYSLTFLPGDTQEVTDALLQGSIDLALLIRSERRPKLEYHDLFQDELGFLLSPLHPWARGRIDRKRLADQRMILYSRNSATFRMVERYFIRMRTELRDWIELGSMEAIKELVKIGLGISIVAPWIARPELEARSLVWLPLPGMKVRRRWSIAAPAGQPLSVAAQAFIKGCQSVAAQSLRRDSLPPAVKTPR